MIVVELGLFSVALQSPVFFSDQVGRWALPIPPQLSAVASARAWLTEHVSGFPTSFIDDAVLMTSELVTNAIRHGRPQVVMHLDIDGPGVRVAISDRSDVLPHPPLADPDAVRPSGRGLLIVDSLASDWGVTVLSPGHGKSVWFQLLAS